MFDTIIRGGKVVDGSGGVPYSADIGLKHGVIAEIGAISSPARNEIDADGAVVTPGFIDIHTHYDGQFLWDNKMDPSFSHGVTLAIAGNCGVGFAPVRHDLRDELIDMMEGVEDIPGIVMNEGLDWNWTSFGDYLGRLSERHYGIDVASHITHAPLRVFTMGERALRHEQATPEDLATMSALVHEAMEAGAVGFSAGRLVEHATRSGHKVPGVLAQEDELIALGRAMGKTGKGVFQVVPRGAVGSVMGKDDIGGNARLAEHALYVDIARASGRPLTYSIADLASDPDDLRTMVAASEDANSTAGVSLHPQIGARAIGGINMLDAYHVFVMKPTYRKLAHLPVGERVVALRDPDVRRAILSEADDESAFASEPAVLSMLRRLIAKVADTYVIETGISYEPRPSRKVGAMAAASGKTSQEFLYDWYTAGDGTNFNVQMLLNFGHGNLDHFHDLVQKDLVVSGLSDGGAHVKSICDSSMTTYQIAYWTRDRQRGPRLPLELMVRKLTHDNARLYGFADRGLLAPGMKADINVLDYDNLNIRHPFIAHDLPSGAPRYLQESAGYLATLVAGEVTRRFDIDTGARPGRLARPS